MKEIHSLVDLSWQVTGPVLVAYVRWILQEAQRRNLHRLYFLARDGYLLCKIAERFCSAYGYAIECRYLYCSRVSLRIPSYHLIGEEAYDLLTLRGYRVTLLGLMQRIGLNEEERKAVYNDIGLLFNSELQLLTNAELDKISEKLRKSNTFRFFVEQKSRQAYPEAMGYFRQEGLFNEPTVAIVDSGWTGSMQRSLRQLLESEGGSVRLIGFYFGMYTKPKDSRDGTYLTWYFDGNSGKLNKVLFCNNLFECMLSAPHGMTMRYEQAGSEFRPVLKPDGSDALIHQINEQIHGVISYTDECLKTTSEAFSQREARRKTQQLLRRIMTRPSQMEASLLGSFNFCDDVTEEYRFLLASPEQTQELKEYLIYRRILRKVLGSCQTKYSHELFWPCGSISFLSPYVRWWFRLNIHVWEWLRYTLK